MGRPIKRKFFGVDNTADAANYGSGAGGEGISSFTYTNRGTYYSQGLTATVNPSPIGGTTAVVAVSVSTANGRVNSITISTAGDGYTTAPALQFAKPGNVSTTATYVGGNIITVGTTTGLFVGMIANTGFADTTTISAIWTGNSNVLMTAANTAPLSSSAVTFFDRGSGVNIATVLANPTTLANTIQANAWTTTSGVGQQADIVSQRSSRRYKVTNATETDVVRLVPSGLYGASPLSNNPTVAQVVAAGGPVAAGQMTIIATDSDGGKYLVGKLESRTALLFPAAIGGSAGTQFAANSHVIWTSTGVAEENVSVKIATND